MKHAIPTDWDGETFCRFAICWPDSPLWRALLRGLVTEPARGYFWDERTGQIKPVLQLFRQTMDYNIELWEVIMACNDNGLQEVADAIQALATATANASATASANCCDNRGSGGTGQSQPPYNPTQEGNPETEPPPEGFEFWEQFFANKCAVATDIVQTLIGDIGRMTTINLVALTLAAAATALIPILLTPIPHDDILVIASILVIAIGFGQPYLGVINDVLVNNFNDLVCALYVAQTSEEAEVNFQNTFAEKFDETGQEIIFGFSAKNLINYMIGPSVTNRLFTLETTRILPPGDCSSCSQECEAFFQNMENGGFLAEKLNDTDFRAVFSTPNNRWELLMAVNHDPDDHTSFTNWTGPMMVIGYEVLSGTISGIPVPPSPVRFVDQANNVIGGGSSPQEPHCCAGVIMVSDNQFTVRFFCVSPCP